MTVLSLSSPVGSMKRLSRCHEILQRIPPGQTILEVVVQKPHFGVPIYEHFAHWYIVEKNGRVSGTFGSPTWPYYEHFRLTDPIRYHPNMGWLVKDKPKVDPGRMMETYNFAMLIGEDQGVLAELKRVGRVVEHRYPITLLEISGFHHEPGRRDLGDLSASGNDSGSAESRIATAIVAHRTRCAFPGDLRRVILAGRERIHAEVTFHSQHILLRRVCEKRLSPCARRRRLAMWPRISVRRPHDLARGPLLAVRGLCNLHDVGYPLILARQSGSGQPGRSRASLPTCRCRSCWPRTTRSPASAP